MLSCCSGSNTGVEQPRVPIRVSGRESYEARARVRVEARGSDRLVGR